MMVIQKLLALFARVFVGSLYAYAGLIKLTEPFENFRGLLTEYTLLPPFAIPFLAWMTPWIEVIFGTLLVLGLWRKLSAFILAGLSISFVVVLLLSRFVLGVMPEHCGCFGEAGPQLTTTQVIYLDIFNTFLCLWLFRIKRSFLSLDSFLERT